MSSKIFKVRKQSQMASSLDYQVLRMQRRRFRRRLEKTQCRSSSKRGFSRVSDYSTKSLRLFNRASLLLTVFSDISLQSSSTTSLSKDLHRYLVSTISLSSSAAKPGIAGVSRAARARRSWLSCMRERRKRVRLRVEGCSSKTASLRVFSCSTVQRMRTAVL